MSSHLLAMSFDTGSSPSITLKAGRDGSLDAPAGWGFAWYPMDDAAATIVKDPNATHETPLTRVLRDWDRFRSSVFLCHTHGAAKRVTQQDTHPFQRSWAGRDWIFAHSGDLGVTFPRSCRSATTRGSSPSVAPTPSTRSAGCSDRFASQAHAPSERSAGSDFTVG
ncbi:MAG: class II glutamine amidotransferase [Sandaracinus sp.]|nr:class II glutamine amidotransferase [Sandaracinus sp.]